MGVSLSTGNIIVASLEQIFHKEGLRGMYCGLAPTMLALLPFILPSIAVFLPNEIVPLFKLNTLNLIIFLTFFIELPN